MFASNEVENNLLYGKSSAFFIMQLRWYGQNVFSLPKFLPNSIEHWVRALATNLLVVSSNRAGTFYNIYLSKKN